ncbi:hypothetical protein MD484_g8918, partial [Candolleomyces efflorescens]
MGKDLKKSVKTSQTESRRAIDALNSAVAKVQQDLTILNNLSGKQFDDDRRWKDENKQKIVEIEQKIVKVYIGSSSVILELIAESQLNSQGASPKENCGEQQEYSARARLLSLVKGSRPSGSEDMRLILAGCLEYPQMEL